MSGGSGPRKAWRAVRCLAADRGLVHLALEVHDHQPVPAAKILVDRLTIDERWALAERLLVEDYAAVDSRRRRRAAGWLLAGEDVVVSFTADGVHWSIPAGDEILPSLLVSGSYEAGELAAVLAFLDGRDAPGGTRPVVLDVGAHVGTTTIPLARAGYQVVAVEPVSATYELLGRNVEDNDLGDSVRCVRSAVSAGGGVVDIALGGGLGQSEVVSGSQAGGDRLSGGFARRTVEQVPAAGVDEIVADQGVDPATVALVWADTQGCETDVIRTGASLWKAGACAFVEVWPEALENHDGVDAFVDAAVAHFSGFVPSETLQQVGPAAEPQTIDGFDRFVQGLTGDSSDALLVP